MTQMLTVLLFSICAVALFVLGMSLTLIIKGHHIDSEISTNKNMQRLGIKCAVQEAREDSGQSDCAPACSGSCSSCDIASDGGSAASSRQTTGLQQPTTYKK